MHGAGGGEGGEVVGRDEGGGGGAEGRGHAPSLNIECHLKGQRNEHFSALNKTIILRLIQACTC